MSIYPCAAPVSHFLLLSGLFFLQDVGLLHTLGIPARCREQHESISNPSALRQHKGQDKHTLV